MHTPPISKSLKDFIFNICNVSEHAAIASYHMAGRGDEKQADQVAVDAMRTKLMQMDIDGTVVIGEGERDKAPMLYIGERVGVGQLKVDIALDPLEGTTLCAHLKPNALSVLAVAEQGGFLHAPDLYMKKIAVGPHIDQDAIDLDYPISKNLDHLAQSLNRDISDLCVSVLERERHKAIIEQIRQAGARIQLIPDGDVAAVIATTLENHIVDMYIGIGGAPEGVLAAAALACTGGFMQARLCFDDQAKIERATKMGIDDIKHKYSRADLAKGNIVFSASGVSDGFLVEGVKLDGQKMTTQTLLMHNIGTPQIQYIKTQNPTC
ncbi:MAG: class II fructose-bisphosphatase [Pseudomonadota bacterium]